MGVGEFELSLVLVELSEQVASQQQVGVDADRGFQGLVVTAAAVQLVFAGRLPGPRVLPPRSPDAGRRHEDNTVPDASFVAPPTFFIYIIL